MSVRPAYFSDADAIAEIYNRFILETTITFEETPIASPEIVARMKGVEFLSLPWLVWHEPDELGAGGRICGYAYAGKFRDRVAYRNTVETAIYVNPADAGRGIGKGLYRALIDDLRGRKLHRAVAGIALPNPASVRLHEQLGFKHVGIFTEVGFKFEQWLDVGFWELDLSDSH